MRKNALEHEIKSGIVLECPVQVHDERVHDGVKNFFLGKNMLCLLGADDQGLGQTLQSEHLASWFVSYQLDTPEAPSAQGVVQVVICKLSTLQRGLCILVFLHKRWVHLDLQRVWVAIPLISLQEL